MPGGYTLAAFGPVGGGGGGGREAAFYGGSGARDRSAARDELASRVYPAIQELPPRADYLRAYHRPRKKKESSGWALVRSVGRKISGLWPFWSSEVRGEDDESVIARRRLGKSSRRLRPPPPPPPMHGRGRYNGMNRMMHGPRLDRGPMVGALWSVSVEPVDDTDGEDDYMVSLL